LAHYFRFPVFRPFLPQRSDGALPGRSSRRPNAGDWNFGGPPNWDFTYFSQYQRPATAITMKIHTKMWVNAVIKTAGPSMA